MGKDSKIEWTHHTFNPWIGCVKVSEGCRHCYAEAQNKRWGKDLWGVDKPRQVTSDTYWKQPYAWNAEAEQAGARRRVFCASMADVFEDRPDLDEPRIQLFNLISYTPALDWLLLTKRPQNIMPLVGRCWGYAPLPSNVWLGTSVENQKAADERIPHLLAVPAAVRFLSCEPLLGPVDLRPYLEAQWKTETKPAPAGIGYPPTVEYARIRPGIDWVIVGGESGPGARPMHPEWARSLRDQCVEAGVSFHFKQWGEWAIKEKDGLYMPGWTHEFGDGTDAIEMRRCGKKHAGRLLDGREWNEFPKPRLIGHAKTPAAKQGSLF